ncbi:hypothetical protein KUTeg_020787 [Tegillarca granosa]|uniref:Chitin-binding type-2 domain-containing protein n=1 Tax=Tegillarca granosa TaxID=220873 RepID=A0ABQ9EED9_TEGGR|nr:hypothetical protein KUTeg_020787 [Tegillarca granosa]
MLSILGGVPNPCNNNPLNKGYFPYPGDQTKAIQCDNLGRMYTIQCPCNTVYNEATTSCISRTVTAGRLYFSVPNDNTKFIECDLQGNANILTCPGGLVWNESRLSCVYVFNGNNPTPTPAPLTGLNGNPCRANGGCLTGGFFSHPNPGKFIQCDLACDAYVLSCPAGLVWNQYSKNCVSSVQVPVAAG